MDHQAQVLLHHRCRRRRAGASCGAGLGGTAEPAGRGPRLDQLERLRAGRLGRRQHGEHVVATLRQQPAAQRQLRRRAGSSTTSQSARSRPRVPIRWCGGAGRSSRSSSQPGDRSWWSARYGPGSWTYGATRASGTDRPVSGRSRSCRRSTRRRRRHRRPRPPAARRSWRTSTAPARCRGGRRGTASPWPAAVIGRRTSKRSSQVRQRYSYNAMVRGSYPSPWSGGLEWVDDRDRPARRRLVGHLGTRRAGRLLPSAAGARGDVRGRHVHRPRGRGRAPDRAARRRPPTAAVAGRRRAQADPPGAGGGRPRRRRSAGSSRSAPRRPTSSRRRRAGACSIDPAGHPFCISTLLPEL